MIHLLQIAGVLFHNATVLGRCNMQEQHMQLFKCQLLRYMA